MIDWVASRWIRREILMRLVTMLCLKVCNTYYVALGIIQLTSYATWVMLCSEVYDIGHVLIGCLHHESCCVQRFARRVLCNKSHVALGRYAKNQYVGGAHDSKSAGH